MKMESYEERCGKSTMRRARPKTVEEAKINIPTEMSRQLDETKTLSEEMRTEAKKQAESNMNNPSTKGTINLCSSVEEQNAQWEKLIDTRETQIGGSHYKDMTIQPWEALEAWQGCTSYAYYLHGTAIAYLARAGKKNSFLEDVEKAHHVLSELIRVLKEKEND